MTLLISLNSPHEAKRTHYPHLLAPPSLRTSNLPSTRPQRYLNPALWDAVTLGNKTAESQLQAYMWQTESTCNPTRTFTPDSVTTYDYDYDNRLTTVNLPTNNDTVEYTYDATGRRLTKEYTYHNGANTDVTTYKYHYIGSQITEIEINAIRNPGESQTTLRDEEIKIHLGANSQPISYEWVKHISGNTTSATYYYHYDIHGNVLKVTDSSENTKITYTYDVQGKILTESNPDSVLNFFTFRGASQTIWEPEIGMYYSGGYYRPDTGTALQGTGAPVLTNPASGAMLNSIALATAANAQLAAHAAVSASSAGVSNGGSPGNFAPPEGPSDGLIQAGNQGPPPTTETVEPIATVCDGSSDNLLVGMPECECGSILCSKCKGRSTHKVIQPKKDEEKGEGEQPEDPRLALVLTYFVQVVTPPELTDEELDLICQKEGAPTSKDIKAQKDKEDEARQKELDKIIEEWGGYKPWMEDEVDKTDWHKKSREMSAERNKIRAGIQWAVFGKDSTGKTALLGYQLKGKEPKLFFSSGNPINDTTNQGFVDSWKNYNLYSYNFTGNDICIHYITNMTKETSNGCTRIIGMDTIQIKIGKGYSKNVSLKAKHYDEKISLGFATQLKKWNISAGDLLILYDGPNRDIIRWSKGKSVSLYRKGRSDDFIKDFWR